MARRQRTTLADLKQLAYDLTGITLSDGRLSALGDRLRRRAERDGGLADFRRRVASGADPAARQDFINTITVNKTDFFREPHHFSFLRDVVATEALARAAAAQPRTLRIWSAGCSTGEEPYSIAMALADRLPVSAGWDVRIVATDIDTEVLTRAAAGRYPRERVVGVPVGARRYFRKDGDALVVDDAVRERVEFRPLNLLGDWSGLGRFDLIFCRNVVIYFDRDTQRRLFARYADRLEPHGYLFVGHSESLMGVSDRFALIGQTVHRLVDGTARAASVPARPRPISRRLSLPRRPRPAGPPARVAAGVLRDDQTPHRRIVVGETAASASPLRVSTVLGSCVSACLFDPVAGVGGMNHFLLPSIEGEASTARYGVHAMEQLINEIMKLGGDRRRLQAKLFGASRVIHAPTADVPRKNAEFARRFLATEGIPLVYERLEGNQPLEVHFFTGAGRALVRAVPSTSGEVQAAESAAQTTADDGEVELWAP